MEIGKLIEKNEELKSRLLITKVSDDEREKMHLSKDIHWNVWCEFPDYDWEMVIYYSHLPEEEEIYDEMYDKMIEMWDCFEDSEDMERVRNYHEYIISPIVEELFKKN